MDTRRDCPVCHSGDLRPFFHRTAVPIHENMVCPTRESAVTMPRGELDLRCCQRCGFAFNAAFDPALMRYSVQYDNTQTHSTVFSQHVLETIEYLLQERGLRGKTILEVGCGKGDFLRRLVQADDRNRGIGVDPTCDADEHELGGRLRFLRRYFAADCAELSADVTLSRHMIEHVADPVDLFRTARQVMRDSTDGRLFIETRDVEWALRSGSICDFVYEACSYFNRDSIASVLAAAGMQVTHTRQLFGGQYLLAEAAGSSTDLSGSFSPGEMPALCEGFARRAPSIVHGSREYVSDLARKGPVAIWGAATKGMTFANIVDPTATLIRCAIDLNPRKQNAFLPGTGHPILPPHRGAAAACRPCDRDERQLSRGDYPSRA
jgi:SAM-dependent methyltransferase